MHPRALSLSVLSLAALLLQCVCLAQVNEHVAAGKIKVAKASWWGFDPVESTTALQAAIDSGAEKLIVENMGKPWIVDRMTLASNQEIVFEPGVEVLAKKGAFKGKTDALFRADLKENITLRGYDATLRMQQADYDGPEYDKAEWRHVLTFRSCTNIKVYGLTLTESGGDGIYLGTAKAGVTNKNVHIKDVICDKNYRQGISVITAENLLIENTILRETNGTAPRAGIDFEPNRPGERLVNCVMRDCTSENNGGYGYVLYLPPMTAESEPVSVRIENCTSTGDACGAGVVTGNEEGRAVRGSIEFIDCIFADSRSSGITVGNKPVNGCAIRFENCAVLNTGAEAPLVPPVLLSSRQGASESIGGIEFKDCVIRDSLDRNPIDYVDMAGGVPLKDITGNLTLEGKGEPTKVTLTKELLAKWMPIIALRDIPRVKIKGVQFAPILQNIPAEACAPSRVRLRRGSLFILHATEGDEVSLRFAHQQVAKYSGKTIPVLITGPSGEEVAKGSLPFKEETDVTFTAPETGSYRISVNAGGNYIQLLAASNPVNIAGQGMPIGLYAFVGELYFAVPAGTTSFGVRVAGEGMGESVKAALIDSSGKVVEEADNITRTHQFEVDLPEPSPGSGWSLRFSRASQIMMEDYSVDLRGVPPLLAPSRQALMRPVK